MVKDERDDRLEQWEKFTDDGVCGLEGSLRQDDYPVPASPVQRRPLCLSPGIAQVVIKEKLSNISDVLDT